jgi:multiple sugar transport system substrate-binding protein
MIKEANPLRSLSDHQMTRRGLLSAAGASLALGTLAACSATGSSSKSSSSGDSNTLTIMSSGLDASSLALLQKYCGDPAGAKLKLITVKDETYAAQAASAQKAGNSPDLVQWTSEGMVTLIGAGLKLVDLKDRQDAENGDDFYEQDIQAGTYDDKLYALAINSGSRAIAYRTDWASGTVPAEWSGDQFGEWATSMKASGRYAFGWESKTGDGRSSSNILPLLWSAGGDTVSGTPGNYTAGYDKEQLTTLFTFYHDMIYKYGVTPKDVAGWGYEQTDGGFSKGTLASYSVGPFVSLINGKVKAVIDNLGVAPLPNLGMPKTFWESGALMIHGDSKKQDLAWKVIQNARAAEYQKAVNIDQHTLSVLKSLNTAATDPVLKAFGAILPTAQVSKPVSAAPFMNNLFLPALQQLALTDASPADVADSVLSKTPAVLKTINASN